MAAKPTASLPKKQKKAQRKPRTFGEKEVDFSAILPMPEGYEKLFIAIYLVTIPYVAGLLFLFIFVAKGHFESFMSLDIAMFMAVWAIGYEVVGSLTLAVIFYKMFQFNRRIKDEPVQRERKTKALHEVYDFS